MAIISLDYPAPARANEARPKILNLPAISCTATQNQQPNTNRCIVHQPMQGPNRGSSFRPTRNSTTSSSPCTRILTRSNDLNDNQKYYFPKLQSSNKMKPGSLIKRVITCLEICYKICYDGSGQKHLPGRNKSQFRLQTHLNSDGSKYYK